MPGKVTYQLLAITASRFRRTQRVDVESQPLDTEHAPQSRAHHDHLGVDIRPLKSKRFYVDLMKLAKAAFLRFFIAKHRTHAPHALTLIVNEPVADHGAHQTGRRFGPQGNLFAATILEAV